MTKTIPHFNFQPTCIGSVPFQQVESTCREVLRLFPSIPFWPQFAKRSFLEDMSAQFTEGLPLIVVREEERSLGVSGSHESELELTRFYEHFLAKDTDYFRISFDYAPGLYGLLDLLVQQDEKQTSSLIKGQTVGPVTFASGILDHDAKPLIHNSTLLEAMVNGLAIKALWQVQQLAKTGRRPILFLDEPVLSGFGSAFSSIQRADVVYILRTLMNYVREHSEALIGIHCCGNTDWPMIMDAGPDIINFDASAYMDHFLLYPKEIVEFIQKGGAIAWGIVPTAAFTGKESVEALSSQLEAGLARLQGWGIEYETLAERSLLTPACGMGTMNSGDAQNAMVLLSQLSEQYKKRHSSER